MQTARFVADAALIRELGESLIGRANIALAELVKNSYDADAVQCEICFADDEITVSDNGHGMSEREFHECWMRVGTTHKTKQQVSRILQRPLTGSKGIGRLSCQFLSSEMELWSTSSEDPTKTLYVIVDWGDIHSGMNLNEVSVLWEIQNKAPEYPDGRSSGTKLVLKSLKSSWDEDMIRGLGQEIWVLRSPFSGPDLTDTSARETFVVSIDAPAIARAETAFNQTTNALFKNWRARIHGSLKNGRNGEMATVHVEFKPGYPNGNKDKKQFTEPVKIPIRSSRANELPQIDRVSFEIFIFKTYGRQPGGIRVKEMREYLAKFGNVSVYDAGFRLPYYGIGRKTVGQDWLGIAGDQARRLSASQLLPERLRSSNRYMQDLPAPGRIFGAVHVDTNAERTTVETSSHGTGEYLKIQPGRDRLQDNEAHHQLRDLVRYSLDYYANRYRTLLLQATSKAKKKEHPSRKFTRVLDVLQRNRNEIPKAVLSEVISEVKDARLVIEASERTLDQHFAFLAPLATAGMTALALYHELAREEHGLRHVADELNELTLLHNSARLRNAASSVSALHQRISALRDLMSPLLSDEDKAATNRLRVAPIVREVVSSMLPIMPRVEFDLSGISDSLKFPIGAFAEWSAVLQNVLSNSWNAMLEADTKNVSFSGKTAANGKEYLRISDTGSGLGIRVSDAAELFEPFERRLAISEDNRSIAIGGQGLGLTIVRMIAGRRAARVRFVRAAGQLFDHY